MGASAAGALIAAAKADQPHLRLVHCIKVVVTSTNCFSYSHIFGNTTSAPAEFCLRDLVRERQPEVCSISPIDASTGVLCCMFCQQGCIADECSSGGHTLTGEGNNQAHSVKFEILVRNRNPGCFADPMMVI